MIGVVYNPYARTSRHDKGLLDRLKRIIGDQGVVVAPAEPAALMETMASLRDQGVGTIAMHGGDGTGHRVGTAILETWRDATPEVLWLHGGTMNTVSRSMGQTGTPESQLAAWVRERSGGPAMQRTRRWPLCVEGSRHGFLFGIGIVARFIQAYESGGEPSPAKAAWTLSRAIGSAFTGGSFAAAFFRGIPAEIVGDDTRWPWRSWRILTAGAVDQIGLGFRPFPGVLLHPGCMHVFGSASSPSAFAGDLIPLRFGRSARHPLAHDQVCRRLVIRAEEDLVYNLDGDLYQTGTEVVVETTRPLTFLLVPDARQPSNRLAPEETAASGRTEVEERPRGPQGVYIKRP